ncbi:hypothetical protein DBY21_09615 [Candidatus Gastranaerophilales bacterium]|nr:MAG: hypothetical protein DBY21_09615 [Candidatus Gastranaerophilales bacterium]
MGKIGLGIDLLKSGVKMFKSAGKTAVKDFEFLKASSKCKMPEEFSAIFGSRSGVYKLSPEEKVIDALKEVKTKSGKAKFSEEALRAEIKKVNWGFMRNKDITGQYSDSRCFEIASFAERPDVNLKDVAEFSLLPEHSFGFVNSLSKDRFKIFKEFMRYTKGDRNYILKIGEPNPRRFSFEQLVHISKDMSEKSVQRLRKLVDIKRPEGASVFKDEYVFNGDNLIKLAQTDNLEINSLVKLAKTSGLNGHSICEIAKVKDIDLKAASNVINKIKKSHNGDVCFFVEKDLYEADKFRLLEWSKANDKEVLVKTFDNKMNLISTDKIVPVAGKQNQAKIIGKDFEVVLEPHAVQRKDLLSYEKKMETVSETRKIRDKNGNLLRTEYLTPSKVEGLHNWKAVLPDGTVKPIIDVKMGKNGILTVKKNLEALDGTVTKQNYKRLPDGSWAMRLNISKDGKILSKRNIKHKMFSANEAESVVNGKKYKVHYSSDEIRVLNAKGETDCVIDLKSMIDANNMPENALKLKNMLKECSVDELQVISKKLKTLEFNPNKIDALADCSEGKVSTGDDIFIFRHEMGHIDDLFGTAPAENMKCQGIYSTAKEFRKIYSQELDMFMKEFPQTQRQYVDYFIDHSTFELSRQSFQETVAELLASNKSPDISKLLGTRTEYLERYFPLTRSFLVNT